MRHFMLFFVFAAVLSAGSPRRSTQVYVPGKETDFYLAETGVASWYGPGFVGKLMANGEPYDPMRYTIAHRTIPLGEVVTIYCKRTGKTVVARVTDRGPYVDGRIADMSYLVMSTLGLVRDGVGEVEIYRTADAIAQSRK